MPDENFQVARVRLYGFSDHEISIVRALLMSDIESAYLERDQMQSTSLRDEYLQVVLCSAFRFIFCLFLSADQLRTALMSSLYSHVLHVR